MSRDHAIALQPGQQEQNSISKKRKRKRKKENKEDFFLAFQISIAKRMPLLILESVAKGNMPYGQCLVNRQEIAPDQYTMVELFSWGMFSMDPTQAN